MKKYANYRHIYIPIFAVLICFSHQIILLS